MKVLDFEKMEQTVGGLSYCGLLSYWARNPMDYQGRIQDVYQLYWDHCM